VLELNKLFKLTGDPAPNSDHLLQQGHLGLAVPECLHLAGEDSLLLDQSSFSRLKLGLSILKSSVAHHKYDQICLNLNLISSKPFQAGSITKEARENLYQLATGQITRQQGREELISLQALFNC
jgi:hypothetical protein